MRTAFTLRVLLSIVMVNTVIAQSNIDPLHQYSWGSNTGWMNWRDGAESSEGVRITLDYLEGSVWTENTGWINLGNGDGPYANTDGLTFGVNMSPCGDLSGFAWGENIGWINFGWGAEERDPMRARFDFAVQRIRGFAWGENIGWINLDDAIHFVGTPDVLLQGPQPLLILSAQNELVPLKSTRYLSFAVSDSGNALAIRVLLDDGLTAMWVQQPSLISENSGSTDPVAGYANIAVADLGNNPFYSSQWASLGTIHVRHSLIVSGESYSIQTIGESCDIESQGSFSPELVLATSACGDVVGAYDAANHTWPAPDGVVSVPSDVVACLDKFKNAPNAPSKPRVDVVPSTPDGRIDISDCVLILDAFRGLGCS